jgi:hypothetical protein
MVQRRKKVQLYQVIAQRFGIAGFESLCILKLSLAYPGLNKGILSHKIKIEA